jgi:hypothetical protein
MAYPASKIYGAHVGFSWAKREPSGQFVAHVGPIWAKWYGIWSTGDNMGQLVWVLVIWGPDGLTGVTLSCDASHVGQYGQSGQNHSVKVITS